MLFAKLVHLIVASSEIKDMDAGMKALHTKLLCQLDPIYKCHY